MKKSIIAAGAASVALAAMPVVGAFAAFTGGPFTDTIQTTIADSCTFGRGTLTDTTATGKHPAGTWTTDTSDTNKDVLTAVAITPAAAEATLGSTNFNIICNDQDGYQVAVAAPALTLTSGVTAVHPWNYNNTGSASTAASNWRLTSTGDNVDLPNNIVSKRTAAEDGKTFLITYFAYAQTGQDSGTYSADVVYTATQL